MTHFNVELWNIHQLYVLQVLNEKETIPLMAKVLLILMLNGAQLRVFLIFIGTTSYSIRTLLAKGVSTS